MSNSDTINQQQEREEKVKLMDSMCVMVKGKQTYLGLTRRQWIDRYLDWDPDTSIEELTEAGKVYVITEVIYAETVIVEVDSKKMSEAREMKRIPVAFSYFKFPMSSGGVLKSGKDEPGVNKDADFLLINDQTEKI